MQVLTMVQKKNIRTLSSSPPCPPCCSHMPLPLKKVHTVMFMNETSNYETSKTTGKLRPPGRICRNSPSPLVSMARQLRQEVPMDWNRSKSSCCCIHSKGPIPVDSNTTLIIYDGLKVYRYQRRKTDFWRWATVGRLRISSSQLE